MLDKFLEAKHAEHVVRCMLLATDYDNMYNTQAIRVISWNKQISMD